VGITHVTKNTGRFTESQSGTDNLSASRAAPRLYGL